MNRLVDSSYDGRKEGFTYDKVGNRLTKTTNDITEKYVYNVKNQLKELHNKNGINYFTYDKQGNTIKEETTNGNNIFEYNTLNQQVKAITKDGNTLVSRYDTEGLRAEIEENEKLTKFIFHKGNVLVETDKEFNLTSRFTRGYEVVAADIVDSSEELNSAIESKLNRYYYTVDEQGSTIFITDKNQSVKNEYYYDAFGNVLDSKEEVHNRITYTGQQFDGVTGQYYLRARFYNPVVGRFTQEDIYRGDGLNLYAYCGNNPVAYYDPSGYASNSGKCWSKENPFGLNNEKQKYTDNVKEHTKVSGTYGNDAQNSDILRNELKNAGIQPPPYGNAAHHIVAADAKDAKLARDILSEYGIDYNSASNGVYLPYQKNSYVTTETMHIGSHNGEYYAYVNNKLQQTIEEVEINGGTITANHITNTLDDIRKELVNGTVKLNNPKK